MSYVAVDEGAPLTALGYFMLAMAMTLLARLAMDRRFAGRGLGHALISEALRISLRSADNVGCRGIITDAYRDRVNRYSRNGFVPIEGAAETGPQRMFLDMRTVRAALRH
jgi:predicted N-acetyltransferase YhbS